MICSMCGKKYKYASSLYKHIQLKCAPANIQSPIIRKEVSCLICDKVFQTQRNLARHSVTCIETLIDANVTAKLSKPKIVPDVCPHCNTKYVRAGALEEHLMVCKIKLRVDSTISTATGRLSMHLYKHWFKLAMREFTDKSVHEFCTSRFYSQFYKLAEFMHDGKIPARYRDLFLQFLVKNKIKQGRWNDSSVYERFLHITTSNESPEHAIERYVIFAVKWEEETGSPWTSYWEVASQNKILHDVTLGHISPWVLLVHRPAMQRLASMPSAMLDQILQTFDIGFWTRRLQLKLYQPSIKWIEETL